MKVYHGSTVIVEKPLGKKGYINIYHFEDSDIRTKYRYKSFSEYNEEWLDFILACRTGSKEYLNYDIIEGGIANDKVFNTIELYFSNLIDKATALNRLKFEKPNNQICFVNQQIIDTVLHFESFYEAKGIIN